MIKESSLCEATTTEAALLPGAEERLRKPFDNLAEALRSKSKGKEIIFLQNDGNFGDALIRAGTLSFFRDYGFVFSELDMGRRQHKLLAAGNSVRSGVFKDRLLVYSGSGAWSSFTSLGRRNVERLYALGGSFFVLPTTFETVVRFDDQRLTCFVRDKYESARAAPDAAFCHDMAFHLALVGLSSVLPERNKNPRDTLHCFRIDNEARAHSFKQRVGNRDLSAEGDHRSDISVFLSEIDKYEHVVTDRLHIAIAAVLLGKRLTLAAGGYFKIAAIYKSSILENFKNAAFLEDEAAIEEALSI